MWLAHEETHAAVRATARPLTSLPNSSVISPPRLASCLACSLTSPDAVPAYLAVPGVEETISSLFAPPSARSVRSSSVTTALRVCAPAQVRQASSRQCPIAWRAVAGTPAIQSRQTNLQFATVQIFDLRYCPFPIF